MRSILSLSALIFSLVCHAQVRLPQLIRDSMVLQRDSKIKIWGWASPHEKIKISFLQHTRRAQANAGGEWSVVLPPVKAGGPYSMQIDATNHFMLKDILVGDVWICSGQSNMEHQMALHSVRYADEIAGADYPQIRQFKVPNITNLQQPQHDLPYGNWRSANPQDILRFSAVAYFFAKRLYDTYHVPIGIINTSWGGSPIEAWMSEEALQTFPDILATLKKNKDTGYINRTNREAAAQNAVSESNDAGLREKWFEPSYIPKEWRTINIPGYWEDQGVKDLDGIVWYRREINIPASMAGAAKVFLGRIVDADALYINGTEVGRTTYLYPQRRYTVPQGLLKAGSNLFVIRVTNFAGKGGFVPDKPYGLIAGRDTVDLKGYWQYKVGQVFLPRKGSPAESITLQYQPSALYNAMIAPLLNYSIKGFVWYQGESNTGRPFEYGRLQPAMILDWRKKWNNPEAPFLYVQLPGFMDFNYLPSESGWAQLREAQLQTLSIPHTGMAVAIDLGEWNDVHPERKKEVGDRLALAAQKIAYHENLVSSGPLFQSQEISGNKIILSFTDTGSGLTTTDGEPLAEFAIAGADKKYLWAKAIIQDHKIVVWNDLVPHPLYVRYAWADNPVNPNLCNKEGLPASPFTTDVQEW